MLRKLLILQHNVRNWNTHKHEFYNIYRIEDPDIILLNEHGVKNNDNITLFNYNVHQSNKLNENNDGVAIAIRKNIKYRLIDDFTDEFLAIQIDTTIGEIIIATSYLPPRRPYLPAQDFLRLINSNKPTYIIGDFNARHRVLGHNNNNTVGNVLHTLINSGKILHLGPNFKTFLGHKSMTTPDRVFCNSLASLNYHLKQGPLTPSDHIPLIMILSTSPIQIPISKKFHMNKANWDGFKKDVDRLIVPDLNNKYIEEIDNALEHFHRIITTAMENNIPKTNFKILPHLTTTHHIRLIQTEFNQLYQYMERFGPNRYALQRIKQLQQQMYIKYQLIKNEQWNETINHINETTDSKTFWKRINLLSGKEKMNTNYVKDPNGRKVYGDKEKEVIFRNIWRKVFKITEEENEEFDTEHEDTILEWMQDKIEDITPKDKTHIDLIPLNEQITERELLHNLRKFKEKTPGLSGITRNILINLPQNGIDTLLEIFNATLSAGYFPDELKKTKMIFIPKDGKDNKEIINYRPISLLEVTGKLLEKILNNRLLTYLENNNVLNHRQHGFRKHRGTHTALAIITETIAIARARNEQVNLILRDIKKAFDKVWHPGLKYKILKTNIPTYMKQILCDYLSDRQIHIQIGQHIGPPFEIESGVPQGGCLSPTLFILYTSDMPNPSPYSEYVVFADDVTQIVTYPGKSKQLLALHTKNAIEKINTYEKKWKIQTNINKFTIIPIGRTASEPVIINGDIYPYSTEGNVLGLKITRTGYKNFIKNKIQILNTTLTKLKRFYNLNSNNKKKLYMALVRSILEYPPIPLHAMKKTTLKDLQRIQNKGLRFIYNVRYPEIVSNNDLHNRANIPTIEEVLKNRAHDIWNKIESLEINHNLHDFSTEISENLQQNNWFPLSFKLLH